MLYAQISKEKAVEELNQLIDEFKTITNEAKEFKNYIKNRSIEYNLVFDSGNAGINICKIKNGIIEIYI